MGLHVGADAVEPRLGVALHSTPSLNFPRTAMLFYPIKTSEGVVEDLGVEVDGAVLEEVIHGAGLDEVGRGAGEDLAVGGDEPQLVGKHE